MKHRSLISLADLSPEELEEVIELAIELKEVRETSDKLAGKSVALLFEKPSTRTRVSFEVAVYELGGHPLYLGFNELQLGRGEPLSDTARVLSRYVHCIVARVNSHDSLIQLDRYSTVPVINALSDLEHPCQAIADLMTIRELKGRWDGVKVAWVGDGNNVCNSLVLGCAMLGTDVVVATPPNYEPNKDIIKLAKSFTGKVEVVHDPHEAVRNADVVYTDVWVSMGQEDERKERMEVFRDFQLNEQLLEKAHEDCVVMHCLPAHRGEEITDSVIEGEKSVVFEQAENRLHTQKALLIMLMGKIL